MTDQLTKAGRSFGFESEVIRYVKPAKAARYTPDFVIIKKDGTQMYIESKGRFLTADRQKHLLIKDQHPELDIRFVFQRATSTISKTSSTTYAKWATDKGFIWADKGRIPEEWLSE